MARTTYYASSTRRRTDGVPLNDAADAEFLARETDYNVFAVTEGDG